MPSGGCGLEPVKMILHWGDLETAERIKGSAALYHCGVRVNELCEEVFGKRAEILKDPHARERLVDVCQRLRWMSVAEVDEAFARLPDFDPKRVKTEAKDLGRPEVPPVTTGSMLVPPGSGAPTQVLSGGAKVVIFCLDWSASMKSNDTRGVDDSEDREEVERRQRRDGGPGELGDDSLDDGCDRCARRCAFVFFFLLALTEVTLLIPTVHFELDSGSTAVLIVLRCLLTPFRVLPAIDRLVRYLQDALFIMHLAFCYVPPPSEEQENEFLAAMASVHYEERKVFRPKHIKLGATEEGDRTCSICLCEAGREIEQEDDAARLPCGHTFHTSCIREWLHRSTYCPLRCPDMVLPPKATWSPQESHAGVGRGSLRAFIASFENLSRKVPPKVASSSDERLAATGHESVRWRNRRLHHLFLSPKGPRD
eukprot:g28084.t1